MIKVEDLIIWWPSLLAFLSTNGPESDSRGVSLFSDLASLHQERGSYNFCGVAVHDENYSGVESKSSRLVFHFAGTNCVGKPIDLPKF